VNLLFADLSGLPPINIYFGAHELLVGEILDFAERARAASVNVTIQAVPEGQHLFLFGAGRVPETDAAITDMGRWLRSKLDVTS
jgi:acetyl esterase/lipase